MRLVQKPICNTCSEIWKTRQDCSYSGNCICECWCAHENCKCDEGIDACGCCPICLYTNAYLLTPEIYGDFKRKGIASHTDRCYMCEKRSVFYMYWRWCPITKTEIEHCELDLRELHKMVERLEDVHKPH
jgi:hypothetical protein